MLRRLLESQSFKLEETQQENIFYIRCKVFENTCSLIVDSVVAQG